MEKSTKNQQKNDKNEEGYCVHIADLDESSASTYSGGAHINLDKNKDITGIGLKKERIKMPDSRTGPAIPKPYSSNENNEETEVYTIETNLVEPDYLDDLKRLQAEFENYRKRIEKEKAEWTHTGTAMFIAKILDINENLEKAAKETNDEGVKIISRQFREILEKEGLKEIEAKEFNPELHEAIGSSEEFRVVQKGYTLNNKIIRHAKVLTEEEKCQK